MIRNRVTCLVVVLAVPLLVSLTGGTQVSAQTAPTAGRPDGPPPLPDIVPPEPPARPGAVPGRSPSRDPAGASNRMPPIPCDRSRLDLGQPIRALLGGRCAEGRIGSGAKAVTISIYGLSAPVRSVMVAGLEAAAENHLVKEPIAQVLARLDPEVMARAKVDGPVRALKTRLGPVDVLSFSVDGSPCFGFLRYDGKRAKGPAAALAGLTCDWRAPATKEQAIEDKAIRSFIDALGIEGVHPKRS